MDLAKSLHFCRFWDLTLAIPYLLFVVFFKVTNAEYILPETKLKDWFDVKQIDEYQCQKWEQRASFFGLCQPIQNA